MPILAQTRNLLATRGLIPPAMSSVALDSKASSQRQPIPPIMHFSLRSLETLAGAARACRPAIPGAKRSTIRALSQAGSEQQVQWLKPIRKTPSTLIRKKDLQPSTLDKHLL